jgi:hypothetical protein
MSALTDASLEARVPGKDYTAGVMLHGSVCHQVYHSGQISLLKKAIRKS